MRRCRGDKSRMCDREWPSKALLLSMAAAKSPASVVRTRLAIQSIATSCSFLQSRLVERRCDLAWPFQALRRQGRVGREVGRKYLCVVSPGRSRHCDSLKRMEKPKSTRKGARAWPFRYCDFFVSTPIRTVNLCRVRSCQAVQGIATCWAWRASRYIPRRHLDRHTSEWKGRP